MQRSHLMDLRPAELSPPCVMCGTPMFLSCIEPADEAGHDRRTFECMACQYSQTAMVKYTEVGEAA
jgi:hypothetical protein